MQMLNQGFPFPTLAVQCDHSKGNFVLVPGTPKFFLFSIMKEDGLERKASNNPKKKEKLKIIRTLKTGTI